MGDSSSSASYIHLVQHLIEKCLIFQLTKEECMDVLSRHANINPIITSTEYATIYFGLYMNLICDHLLEADSITIFNSVSPASNITIFSPAKHAYVWNELVKENKEFFEPYMKSKSKEGTMISQEETTEMTHKMISALDSYKGAQQDD